MKIFIALLLLSSKKNIYGQHPNISNSPLAIYSKEWNENKFSLCNTGAGFTYLNDNEKEVNYIINLIRTYPQLFCKTVLNSYPKFTKKEYLFNNKLYYQSLMNELLMLPQKQLLLPDKLCFVSAFCHPNTDGKSG